MRYVSCRNFSNILLKPRNSKHWSVRNRATGWMWQEPKTRKGEYQSQKYDFLLVVDFEATCDIKGSEPKPQEIIEFPCALISTKKSFEVVSVFHEYVRPVRNPILSCFCTELTGITQVSVLCTVLH